MNTAKKIILVPIDFSEQSIAALNQAKVIAKAMGGELFLLHVTEEHGFISSLFSGKPHDEVHAETWKHLNELCIETEKSSNTHTSALVAHGKIYEEIVHAAELVGASFIVMGTNGSSKSRRPFIGSNALRVVRESRVPVISIKGQPTLEGFKRIILPLDLTSETRQKVNKAIELSRLFGAEVKIVSILLTEEEEFVNKLQLQINMVHHFLQKAEINCTAEIINIKKGGKSLGEELIEYSKQVNGDLFMIMTQQETNFTDLFIGSAAQEIINNSEIPVCSIIPTVRTDAAGFKPY
jgi:nucleotide-binding universal stress UspA family protein